MARLSAHLSAQWSQVRPAGRSRTDIGLREESLAFDIRAHLQYTNLRSLVTSFPHSVQLELRMAGNEPVYRVVANVARCQ